MYRARGALIIASCLLVGCGGGGGSTGSVGGGASTQPASNYAPDTENGAPVVAAPTSGYTDRLVVIPNCIVSTASMNDADQIAGNAFCGQSDPSNPTGFLYEGHVVAETANVTVTGINNNGIAVGYILNNGTIDAVFFAGGCTTIPDLRGFESPFAFGVNTRGMAVGATQSADATHWSAFVSQNGETTQYDPSGGTLQSYGWRINDNNQVLGVVWNANSSSIVLFSSPQNITTLATAPVTYNAVVPQDNTSFLQPAALNNRGHAIYLKATTSTKNAFGTSFYAYAAYFYNGTSSQKIDVPQPTVTMAMLNNNDAAVLQGCTTTANLQPGTCTTYLYQNGKVTSLASLIPSEASAMTPVAFNDNGQILLFDNAFVNVYDLLTPSAEPPV